jgi:hypothetical protein
LIDRLRRHPLPLRARFRHSLVLAYAFAPPTLEALLPRGLVLDRYGDHALAAVALVQTERLRPAFFPRALGRDSFYAGYRVFVRVAGRESLRGLYILRTDTDDRLVAWLGRLTTHYKPHSARVTVREDVGRLDLEVRPDDREANLRVTALLDQTDGLPAGSPFADIGEARRFAGPLPYTFHAERDQLVAVRGLRTGWEPQPVAVDVHELGYFERLGAGELANAFYVGGVEYRWERGHVLSPRRDGAGAHRLG